MPKIFSFILRSTLAGFLMMAVYLFGQVQHDIVHGNLIQFNDNGLWCWFQDERVIVDTLNGKMIIGSDASGKGTGGQTRNGSDEAVLFDLSTYIPGRFILNQWQYNCDDHNSAGFIIRPDGKYLAMYDQHYDNYVTRYRIFTGNSWAPEQTYDWRTKPGEIDYTLAYNNVYYLSAEGRMYDFQRANHRSPNFLVSTDMGNTWAWGGQLTTNSSNSYNKGYYKYWSNGIDRIDFIFTEQHPRDTLTSIYHGYIKGGKAFKSDGSLVDDNIFDTTFIPTYKDFTKVFGDSTIVGNIAERRCWQCDLMRYDDGTIAAIITARTNQSLSPGYPDDNIDPDHDFIYCKYDGKDWSYTYLGKAGHKLYSSEADYTGLACLCPNDPNTLYISTPRDPRDTTIIFNVREIFKGVTSDNGTSWNWTPITESSESDNLRPVVPYWDTDHTALLWCRGTYSAAQVFDAAVVGIIDNKSETSGKLFYADASKLNTTLALSDTLITTGPNSDAGIADNKWHERTGYGNGGSVFTSAEIGGEDAPELKTRLTLPEAGTYDIWVNFWGSTSLNADWRIKAGLTENSMQLFRQMACEQVDSTDYYTPIITTGGNNTFLYRAYIGRVNVTSLETLSIFIDDDAVKTGTNSLTGDIARTWYDGISYAKVYNGPKIALLTLSNQSIDFGKVNIGGFKKDSLLISNNGADTLYLDSIISTNSNFSHLSSSLTLMSGQSKYLVIIFSPKDTLTQSGYIIMKSRAAGITDTVALMGLGSSALDVDNNNSHISNNYSLSQNYPNPFNPTTVISYQLPRNSFVTLKVYDILGREVITLINSKQNAGKYQVVFSGRDLASGIYIYKIEAIGDNAKRFLSIRKLVLLK